MLNSQMMDALFQMSQSHLETYTSEADTTQEDTPQSHHYNSHTLAAPSSHYRHGKTHVTSL